jgi:hypothetical protein
MATLKQLVEAKLDQIEYDETNLEKGRVWAYSPSTEYNDFNKCFCWIAPSRGQVIIDIWGAGGSGARMCCCGFGLPGNPGAWSRKCICVDTGCIICGTVGKACNNADTLCFRGCSEASCICWFGRNQHSGAAVDGCMCAQGGRGGTSYCSTTTGPYCCFTAGNFCSTAFGSSCGMVCNFGPGTGSCCAESYGGDINKRGGFSCVSFMGNNGSSCPCSQHVHVAIPPGFFGCEGAVVTHGLEADNGFSQWSGMGFHQFIHGLNALNRSPARGIPATYCWVSSRACGCYDTQGCIPRMPPGTGGGAAQPCPDVRDNGWLGGWGLVRINFIERT